MNNPATQMEQDKIEFNEDDVDHSWDTPRYDEQLGLWYVGGIQGHTMNVLVKAETEEQALERAEDLYSEQA